LLSWYP